MKIFFVLLMMLAVSSAACQSDSPIRSTATIGKGQVPDMAIDGSTVHVVWGKGDSILYAFSADKGGSFSAPEVVDVVPKLFSFAMRGPQITSIRGGACIVACTQQGNLVAYQKKGSGHWIRTARVNDRDTIAKEGFLDLQSDGGQNLFAAWLDLRKDRLNNIFGARSTDGGKTWLANKLLYQSPDGHVCECCKPSVAVQKNKVGVMFRNWTGGYRDLWLIRSSNGGDTFEPAEKLGEGSWKLAGCPMDGGSLAWDKKGDVHTVWRRRDTIFASSLEKEERALGVGKGCTIVTIGNQPVYAWLESGSIVLLTPAGNKLQIGKGNLPVIKAIDNSIICVWENDKEIKKMIVPL